MTIPESDDAPATSDAPPEPAPSPAFLGRAWRVGAGLILAVGLLAWFGGEFWKTFSEYRQASEASGTSAPVGYVGVGLRRTYNDKPPVFFRNDGGRKRLWSGNGADGSPEFYDVTDAAFEVDRVCGGFGHDSIPGIDYPLFKAAGTPEARALRDDQPVLGVASGPDAPRAYPVELLRKIEVVNDEAGGVPVAIVYERENERARFYDRRLDGQAVTFGTTGYAFGPSSDPNKGRPLLYDRKTKSLWLPEDEALVCVNGPKKGARLPVALQPEETTTADWRKSHPKSVFLLGSSREGDRKPIPSE